MVQTHKGLYCEEKIAAEIRVNQLSSHKFWLSDIIALNMNPFQKIYVNKKGTIHVALLLMQRQEKGPVSFF